MTRKELIEAYNQAAQKSGTLTVLHTNAVAHKVGLSATEFEALDIIRHNQPLNAGRLARFCGLTTGAITGLVDRLISAGFAKRSQDPKDRRRVLICTTENRETMQKVHELYRPLAHVFDEFVDELTDEELAFLLEKQERINSKIETIIASMQKQ